MSSRHRQQAANRYARKNFPELFHLFKAGETPGRIRNWLTGVLCRSVGIEVLPQIPLKHIRLQQLLDAGFNVVDYRYWLQGQLSIPGLEDLYRQHGRLSIRNFIEEKHGEPSPQLPVLYDISSLSLLKSRCLAFNQEYHTLVNQALPLSDSLYSGGLILMNDKDYMVYCIKGYGTPRSADQPDAKPLVFKSQFGEPIPDWAPKFITDMSQQLQTLMSEFRPITLEFSLYPYPVGLLNRPEVFWEWRGGSTHDLYRMIGHALPQFKSFELVGEFESEGKKILPFPPPQALESKVKIPVLSLPTPRGNGKLSLVK